MGSEENNIENAEKPLKSQLVIVMPDEVSQSKNVCLRKFRYPSTQSYVSFLLDYEKKKIYELNHYDEGHRSWFIKESVISDGSFVIATKFDPIYLVLPYIAKTEKNQPLDHLLEEQSPEMVEIIDFLGDMSCVADRKGSPDLNIWKYNSDLTMKWLEERIIKLKELLQVNDEPTAEGYSAVLSGNYKGSGTDDRYMRLAFGIMSDYLTEDMSKTLRTHLNIPVEKPKENDTNIANKKMKVSNPTDDYSNTKTADTKAATNQSKQAKALAKSAKGTKNIMSFFQKK